MGRGSGNGQVVRIKILRMIGQTSKKLDSPDRVSRELGVIDKEL